jgi:hypothetical protein
MDNLPALLQNATQSLVTDLSVKCQRNVNFKATVLMLTLKKSLRTFPVIVSNNYPRIRDKH